MIELPLVFLGGLLGSSHCIGMCGPIALALGNNQDRMAKNLRRQLIYSLGRIFTYSALGAMAGFGGLWLTSQEISLLDFQAWLAIGAGVILIGLGLWTAGLIPRRYVPASVTSCLASGWMKSLLNSPDYKQTFLAGLFSGFLPCGLVYGFLAMAAATSSMLYGSLTMVLFGLGTVPLMVVAGCGGTLIGASQRARLLKVAAWCVILTGAITLTRGVGFLNAATATAASCPLCP